MDDHGPLRTVCDRRIGGPRGSKSCGMRIRWARTDAGRMLALNADPDPSGTVILNRQIGDHPHATITKREPHPGEERYRVHVADCKAQRPVRRKPAGWPK